MDFLILGLGCILIAFGLIGCFISRLPAALIAFIGILIIHFGSDLKFETNALVIVGVLTLFATFIAKKIPTIISKIHEVGKAGKWGSIIGSIIGLGLLAAYGMDVSSGMLCALYVIGFGILPFGLSFLFELANKHELHEALMTGLASYVSYLLGALLNLAICCYGIYTVIAGI